MKLSLRVIVLLTCGVPLSLLHGSAQSPKAQRTIASIQESTIKNAPQSDSGIVQDKPATAQASDSEEDDDPIKPVPESAKKDPHTAVSLAWETLRTGNASPKPQNRIDAIHAISTMTPSADTRQILIASLKDTDRDVRISGIMSVSAMQDRSLIPNLRELLNDHAPEAAFAAAVSLWKLHDHTGENVLYSVFAGERKASSGFFSSGVYQANKELRNPSTLAVIGAEQGAYAMLGPLGMGLDAYRLFHKSSNGSSARVIAGSLIVENRSEQTKKQLIEAINDKDYFVRGLAAKGLGSFHGPEVNQALLAAFGDPKPAVRFMAAASLIRSASEAPKQSKSRKQTTTKSSPQAGKGK